MNHSNLKPEQVDTLLERSFAGEPPPNVASQLLEGVRDSRRRLAEWEERKPRRRWRGPRRLAWAGGLAAAGAAVLIAFVFLPQGPAQEVYARAIRALEGVQSVHVSGFGMSSLFRGQHQKVPAADRYDIDGWIWAAGDGGYRQYMREGPIVTWDDGERRYSYNEHIDSLRVDRSRGGRQRGRNGILKLHMKERLRGLTDNSSLFKDLGVQLRNGREVRVARKELPRGKRKEWWFDVQTGLMVHETRHKWKDGEWCLHWYVDIVYDVPVPSEILAYSVPDAKNVEYSDEVNPEFEQWQRHLQRLAARYETAKLPEFMEIAPWQPDEELEHYSRSPLPGHFGYSVEPVSKPLGWYFSGNDAVSTGGRIRISKELQRIQLNLDLVCKQVTYEEKEEIPELKKRTSALEKAILILEHLGLEMVEIEEPRLVWVAQYDGRKLKPWREVKAPFGRDHDGPGRATIWRSKGGFTLQGDVFRLFNWNQDCQLTGRSVMILDETGIPEELEVCSELASFHGCQGETSREVARQWFADEFGITFREETRPIVTKVIRRKQP